MTDILASVPQILLNLARGVGIGMVIMLPLVAIIWWLHRRDQRRWEPHEQLREMEQVIREETLPDWQREVIQEHRQRQAEIAREARRRLRLPDEEP